MIDSNIKYSYKDLSIVPAVVSEIRSRKECNPYLDGYKELPLFTAPMDSVVGVTNIGEWIEHGIIPILPRTESLECRLDYMEKGYWVALGLQEFESLCGSFSGNPKVLIDIANGHMAKVYELVKVAKKHSPGLIVMIGNIANPETYRVAAEAGVDYVRVGIGVGRGCITASNTGVGFGLASLIDEISQIKMQLSKDSTKLGRKLPYIVADGGVRGYSDAIKALALGADYVMIGSVFTKMLESAAGGTVSLMRGDSNEEEKYDLMKFKREDLLYEAGKFKVREDDDTFLPATIVKTFYGMASKKGQLAMNGKKTHTSEGIETTLTVEYTMQAWVENFTDYLRSAMSYAGVRDLQEFKKNTRLVVNSNFAINSINK